MKELPLLRSSRKAIGIRICYLIFLSLTLLELSVATDPMGDCRPLYIEGKYTEAIQCCDEVIREDSSSGPVGFAWFLKSICLSNIGNIKESIVAIDKATEIDSDYAGFSSVLYPPDENNTTSNTEKNVGVSEINDAATWNDRGIIFAENSMFDIAIKCFDEAIRLDPNNAVAWSNKGNTLSTQGKYNESIKCYDEAIRLDPNNAVAWNNKGMDLYDQSKYDEAIKAFDEAIRLRPNYAIAQANKVDAVEALDQQNKDTATIPSMGGPLLELGTATNAFSDCDSLYYDYSEDRQAEMLQCYDEVIRESSSSSNVAYAGWQKSILLYEQGDLEGAIKAIDEAAKIDPQYAQFRFIYKPNKKTRAFTGANLPAYNATKADRNNTTALINDAVDLYDRGMYDESIQRYNEAIELDPENTTARFGMVLDFIENRQLSNITKTLDEIAELGFDDTVVWEDLAISLWREHQLYEEAIRCFDRSIAIHDELIKLNSSSASAWNNKGVCLGLQANVDLDGYLYLTLDFEEASFSKSQAHARYREDKWKEALECFEKATQLDPVCADAWYNKGMALYALNDGYESIEYYEETVYCFDQALRLQHRKGCSRLVDTRYAEVAMRDKLMEMKMASKDVERVAAYA